MDRSPASSRSLRQGRQRPARRPPSGPRPSRPPDDVWQALGRPRGPRASRALGAQPRWRGARRPPLAERLRADCPGAGLLPLAARLRHQSSGAAASTSRSATRRGCGPRSDVDALLAEGDPWWSSPTSRRQSTAATSGCETLTLPGGSEQLSPERWMSCTADYVGSPINYRILEGLQPDLYRCFVEQPLDHSSATGTTSLLHPESISQRSGQENCGPPPIPGCVDIGNSSTSSSCSRSTTMRLWGAHVYGRLATRGSSTRRPVPPRNRDSIYDHDGTGPEPGFKDDGHWDQRPHVLGSQRVNDDVLDAWHEILERPVDPVDQTRMVYTVNRRRARAEQAARRPRIGITRPQFSAGWHEKNDRTKGYFIRNG